MRSVARVGKAGAARKLASAAAYGGGGLSVLGAGLYGLLSAEAKLARRAIGETTGGPPTRPAGTAAAGRAPRSRSRCSATPRAAGYGVERVVETPGALLASGIAEKADRRVHLRSYAFVGARSSDLVGQIDRALPTEPHVAVILIGVNDVTHSVLPSQSVRHLSEAVRRLRDAGVEVVVGTCPDLGTVKPIAPPLKQVGRAWSHRLAAAQTIAVVEEGGRTVSLASILGPEFEAAPAVLFGPDRFHPSAEGYRRLVDVLLPSTLAALGFAPDDEAEPEAYRGEGVLPVDHRGGPGGQDARHRGRRHRGRRVASRRTRPVGRAAPPPPYTHGRHRGAGRRRGRGRRSRPL